MKTLLHYSSMSSCRETLSRVMIAINPDLEVKDAKQNIANIQQFLKKQ